MDVCTVCIQGDEDAMTEGSDAVEEWMCAQFVYKTMRMRML